MNGRTFDFGRMYDKILNEQRDEGRHAREEKKYFNQVKQEIVDLINYVEREQQKTEDESMQGDYAEIKNLADQLEQKLNDHMKMYK